MTTVKKIQTSFPFQLVLCGIFNVFFIFPLEGQEFETKNIDQLFIKGNTKLFVLSPAKDETSPSPQKDDTSTFISVYVQSGTLTKNITTLSHAKIINGNNKKGKEAPLVQSKKNTVNKTTTTIKNPVNKHDGETTSFKSNRTNESISFLTFYNLYLNSANHNSFKAFAPVFSKNLNCIFLKKNQQFGIENKQKTVFNKFQSVIRPPPNFSA